MDFENLSDRLSTKAHHHDKVVDHGGWLVTSEHANFCCYVSAIFEPRWC